MNGGPGHLRKEALIKNQIRLKRIVKNYISIKKNFDVDLQR